jgi:hypothetical protein
MITLSSYSFNSYIIISDVGFLILGLFSFGIILIKKEKSDFTHAKPLIINYLYTLIVCSIWIFIDNSSVTEIGKSFTRITFFTIFAILIYKLLINKYYISEIANAIKVTLYIHCSLVVFQYLNFHIFNKVIMYQIPGLLFNGSQSQLFYNEYLFRSTGLFSEPAFLSGTLILYSWLYFIFSKKIDIMLLFISGICILMSGSFSGIILFAFTFVFVFNVAKINIRLRYKVLIYVCVLIIFCVNINVINIQVIARVSKFQQGTEASFNTRFLGALEALHKTISYSYGLGIGIGNFNNFFYKYSSDFAYLQSENTHNLIFYSGMSNGVIGIALYFYMLFYRYKLINNLNKKFKIFLVIYSFTTGGYLTPLFWFSIIGSYLNYKDEKINSA